jgi:hypothetical protein
LENDKLRRHHAFQVTGKKKKGDMMKPKKIRLKLPLQPTDATKQSFKLQQPSRAVMEKANILVFSLLKPRDFIIISSSALFSLPKIYIDYLPRDIYTNYNFLLVT